MNSEPVQTIPLPPIVAEVAAMEPYYYGRYKLPGAWVENGFVYATDLAILVRTPDRVEYGPIRRREGLELPDLSKLKWDAATPLALPPLPAPLAAEQCPECRGTGSAPCPHCNQPASCAECGGKGQLTPRDRIFLLPGGLLLGEKYAHVLHRHNAVLWWGESPTKAVRFRVGDDVDGLVMPHDPKRLTEDQREKVVALGEAVARG